MFFKALAILLAVPFVTQFVSADSSDVCNRQYIVQPGDTCDGISAANNASTFQLAAVNSGINSGCTNLYPGSTLCLGRPGQDCSTTYVVQLGDDCDKVANDWGTNTTILYANNPQINSDCTNMYVKEVLCVSGTVEVPPIPSSGTIPASAIPATATPAATDLPWCDEM